MSVVQTESVVQLTDKAVAQLLAIQSGDPAHAGKALRVFVEGGCCSGPKYGMMFDQRQAGDLESEFGGVSVLVDPHSADQVRGAVIDFSDAPPNAGFMINNPAATHEHEHDGGGCGCGKSGCC